MNAFIYYIWIALLLFYIISPNDFLPFSIVDDIFAALILWQMVRKHNAAKKRYRQRRYTTSGASGAGASGASGAGSHRFEDPANEPMDIEAAYKKLGVSRTDSMEDIRRAYIEKISKNHPDKVSHLSDELRQKATEITLELNNAFDIIKKHML
jgi:DnaJ-domain-containing protein 1